ncbi:MAG: DHH family phosphoesterase [Clostridia bacterium]|nr:DHH family phosphoesterase [Clostridia bacterium]
MSQRVTIEQLTDWLRDRDDIVVMGHVSPDGDATGSTLALWHALRAMGKRAVVCLPGGMPLLYTWLSGADQILDTETDTLPFEPKTALAVDVSEYDRLGEAGMKRFDSCLYQGVLDHHKTNEGFGQLFVLDGEAAAVGELAVDLITALGVGMDANMAECLFVAISTDCGNFNYSNTRPQTFIAAARCVEAGASADRITEKLYRTRTLGRTRLLGAVLVGLEVSPDGKVAWARLTDEMLRRCDADKEDSEGIINYLIEMIGVKVAVLASERDEGTKLSLRSKTPFNVARDVAVPLGGGGHDCAAGVLLAMPLEEALQKTLAMAREAVDKTTAEMINA